MTTIAQLRGITERHVAALHGAGIGTLPDLIAAGSTDETRAAVSTAVGVSAEDVIRWTSIAILVGVDGVDPDAADHLVEVGLTSVEDLAYSRPRDLAARMAEVSMGSSPDPRRVAQWIAAAHETLHRSYSKDPEIPPI